MMFKDLKVGDKVYHINGRNDVVEEVIKKVGRKYIYIAGEYNEDQKFLRSNGEVVSRMYSKTISLDRGILDVKSERDRIQAQILQFSRYDYPRDSGMQSCVDLEDLRTISKIIDKAEKIYAEKEGK
jgi:hypothetical protein